MALISRKKHLYPVSAALRAYLATHARLTVLPLGFEDLNRFHETIAVYDKRGRDTLWETAIYSVGDREMIEGALVELYAKLKVQGDMSLVKHLVTDRVDLCTWGNTRPFRVRILNTLNENFDYFYIKRADASRIYGLELEHLLSPNRIEFLCDGETVVEEHIAGIPADLFIDAHLEGSHVDEIRLAKEFVKFNERCFVRLLGDMHAGNFVVEVTPDFEETNYQLRPIDFDQQSYEGKARVYKPQYYRENNPIVYLGMRCMTPETMRQYVKEERTLIAKRANAEANRLAAVLSAMANETLSPASHVRELRAELARHYGVPQFDRCESMGDLVRVSLELLPR